jgi:hypothetical protein
LITIECGGLRARRILLEQASAKLETKIRVMDGTTTLTPSHFQNENSFNKILTIQLLPVIYYRL